MSARSSATDRLRALLSQTFPTEGNQSALIVQAILELDQRLSLIEQPTSETTCESDERPSKEMYERLSPEAQALLDRRLALEKVDWQAVWAAMSRPRQD